MRAFFKILLNAIIIALTVVFLQWSYDGDLQKVACGLLVCVLMELGMINDKLSDMK